MLRLDPCDARVQTARRFSVCEGGGEYNVARALANCFRLQAGVVTALVDNQIGRLIESLISSNHVDTSLIRWVEFDGVGYSSRNALNFTERGYGVRPPVGCSDRGHSAASQLTIKQINWREIFETQRTRILHTGGVFAALSDSTAQVASEAMSAAQASGTLVSYDLNYRASLWARRGGQAAANKSNAELASSVDVLFGVLPENDKEETSLIDLSEHELRRRMGEVVKRFPNIKVVATSLRRVRSANRHDWRAAIYINGELTLSKPYSDLEIFDRVGGGDAFAAGVLYGLLSGMNAQQTIETGAAAGALAMTTAGDNLQATQAEVERLAHNTNSASVQR